jgi:membrane protein required for colicin V production
MMKSPYLLRKFEGKNKMVFNPIDVFFIILILVVAFTATAKGFVRAIFGKLSWILAIIGAFCFYKRLNLYLKNSIPNQTVSLIVSFLLIFIIIFLIVKIIQTMISKVFEGEILRGLDKALGFIFGIVEGLAIVILIIVIIRIQPWISADGLFEGSYFYGFLYQFISPSQEYLMENFA